ncbi:MAG TPA: 2-succinyl-5-enolpyruvyl-6-hydroxy-3-cyclohexene-1-carboxylic-acid synthase [Streptosporangiaceae bacterium]|nr:2-succinyl-5-enolpyruvyl-6-hydroxy-3-cyclohexene-1-carboxylic-acid synthase [Streptosporangiaceae bacterium]
MNPSTAQATVLTDELIRCGLREAVVAPGSRSAALALALFDASAGAGTRLRLHVRIDERSAAFLALGLAKSSGRPVAVVCTSGTAAAHFHAAVIEADESGVPLIVLTADRPPELRGTGANQTIDQVKLYGGAVRWFCEVGVAQAAPGQAGYWRSLACRAWAQASGGAGGLPGPVHLNLPFREPLVPEPLVPEPLVPDQLVPDPVAADGGWPDSIAGRAGGAPWTTFAGPPAAAAGVVELPWTERGVVVCGDGSYDPAPLAGLAEAAGWPLLAEPSSNARHGAAAVPAYQYLLDSPEFAAAHRPDVIVSAGRPGLSRGQLAFLRGPGGGPGGGPPARHVVLAQGGGRWADPARSATDVAGAIRLAGRPADARDSGWLAGWLATGSAARSAVDALLEQGDYLSEPRLARDLGALLPDGALLWAGSSLPIRDLDRHLAPRPGLRVLASRGASGIDGLVSSAIGAALAHQAGGGGPAVALLGDLALLHDAAGLVLGPEEPRPDLCLIVVNNDGGGIFSGLEQAAFAGPFERVFGTPHGTDLRQLAGAVGLRYVRVTRPAELPGALLEGAAGLRLVEVRTDRAAGTALRASLGRAAAAVTHAAVTQVAQEMRTLGSSTA